VGAEVEGELVATVVLAESSAGAAAGVLDAASAVGAEDVEDRRTRGVVVASVEEEDDVASTCAEASRI
jgi:hypothetical protein